MVYSNTYAEFQLHGNISIILEVYGYFKFITVCILIDLLFVDA